MLKLLIFILANAGITYNVTSADIFHGFRNFVGGKSEALGKFVKCSLCLGTWLSILTYVAIYRESMIVEDIFLYMMIGGITAYIFTLFIKILKFTNVLLNNKFLKR